MAVQPAHEAPRAPDLRQLLARDAELAVDHHAGGDDHRVVGLDQFVPGEVATDVEIAGKAQVRLVQELIELADHGFGALVVGRDAGPDQPEGRGQAVDDVDAEVRPAAQQPVRGIEAGRAGADDGNPVSHGGPLSI